MVPTSAEQALPSGAAPLVGETGGVQDVEVPNSLVADVFARDCSSRSVVESIAGKWGMLVLLALAEEPRRFNALRRRVDGVSEKMLSQTLQALERDGMVNRDVQTAIPPRVEYSLTDLGSRVTAPLRTLIELVEGEIDTVLAARQSYQDKLPR